jgi:hypothetical protein
LQKIHQTDYNYLSEMDTKCMKPFRKKHPDVMQRRIDNYKIEFNPSMINYKPRFKDIKRRISNKIGKLTGWYPGEYKNYKLIKI